MAAITPYTVALQEMANGTAKTVDVPYTSSFEYFNNLQAYRDAEAARLAEEARLRELAAAEFAAAGSVEDRSKQLIKNMYGAYNGEFGGRVLTEDEIKNGYTNALGDYVPGSPSISDLVSEDQLARQRHMASSQYFYNVGLDHFTGSREVGRHDFNRNRHATGKGDIKDEAFDHIRAMLGADPDAAIGAPWINTYDWDRYDTYNLIRNNDYNAFLGGNGGMQSSANGYTDDSIAGWFKNAFAGQDQVKNRSKAISSLSQFTGTDGAGAGLNKATDLMTKQYFDQMDLANKYGLTWEEAGALNNLGGGQGSPGDPSVLIDDTPMPNGMLTTPVESSWLDVLNRGGASLENWDSLLGQYTYNTPLDWASMDNETVESSFGELFDSGGMFTQGKNRDLIYAKLMENLGRV